MRRFILGISDIDRRVKELRKQIAEIEQEITDLERVKNVVPVLRQLQFHHESQAKPHTPPCAKAYNAVLATHIKEILGVLE